MGHLLAVDLRAVGVRSLQGFADDRVELNRRVDTGLRNMLR